MHEGDHRVTDSPVHDENPTPEQTAEALESAAAADASPEGQNVTQAEYDAVQTQAQEYLEGWQRARADFANYKKRVDRDLKDSQSNATGSVLRNILPAIDDFERAMNHIPEGLQDDPWVKGIGMILRKLNKVLEDYNVTVIDPTGEAFDPNRHEAIGTDDSDAVPSGHVTVTMQKGYLLGDRVLRPALVRVAK
jgi:molecular chaperone GrpE